MELPSNFNEFKNIIIFYREQGVDCLSPNKEKWYFIYCCMNDYLIGSLNDHETCFIGTDKQTVNHNQSPKIADLNTASKSTIISYLTSVCQIKVRPKMKIYEERVIITNEFNYYRLILPKYLFDAYCEYNYDCIITIPVIFDDNGAKLFVECLNKGSLIFCAKDLKYYDQVIELVDYLGVKF